MLQEKEKCRADWSLGGAGGGQGASHERVRFEQRCEGDEEVISVGRAKGFPEREKSQSRNWKARTGLLYLRNS